MTKIFVSTVSFREKDPKFLHLFEQSEVEYQINPLDRKLAAEEVGDFTKDCDDLIAGTENIGLVLQTAKKMKFISRVGIGLDSVPLAQCREQGIRVSYIPDAIAWLLLN